jgi:hypothetical protein
LTFVRSKNQLLEALDKSLPDLILLPALLPPNEESQLLAYLRTLPNGRHLQVMVTPYLFAPEAAPPLATSRGWRRMLARDTRPRAHTCDARSFAEHVRWALGLAQQARDELALQHHGMAGIPDLSAHDRRASRRLPAAELLWLQRVRIQNGPEVRLVDLSAGGVLLETDARWQPNGDGFLELVGDRRQSVCSFRVLRWEPVESDQSPLYRGACVFTQPFDIDALMLGDPADAFRNTSLAPYIRAADDRHDRDPRRRRDEVPCLSSVKLSWGPEVDLLDISSTGMLIETGLRFVPGTTTEFQLSGPDTNLTVPARFVRIEVGAVGPQGVKYRAAARFTTDVQLREFLASANASSGSKALVHLLTKVVGGFDQSDDRGVLRAKFSQGLCALVAARDIQIIDAPAPPREGTESFYFSVPATGRSSAVLQATFERDHHLTDLEFRSLQTAAAFAAVVLELERAGGHS